MPSAWTRHMRHTSSHRDWMVTLSRKLALLRISCRSYLAFSGVTPKICSFPADCRAIYAGQAIPSLVSVKMRTLYGNFLEDEGLLPASRRVIRRRAYGWVPLVSLSEMCSILKRIDVHKDLCEFNGLMTRVVKPIRKLGIDEYQLPNLSSKVWCDWMSTWNRLWKYDNDRGGLGSIQNDEGTNRTGDTINKYSQVELNNQIKRI